MPVLARKGFRLPWQARVNPALKEVEERHIEWMLRMDLLLVDQVGAYRRLGYTSLVARYLPEAEPEDLLVVADLAGISFLMDDLTEESGTAKSIAAAFGEFVRVMSDSDYSPSSSVMIAWKDVWVRLAEPMSSTWRERTRENWRACFAAFHQERQIRDEGRLARLPEYAFTHRVSVGADVYNDLLERAYHFELDPFVNAMPAMQMLRWTVAEHIYHVNDLLSLEKDERTGDENNLIHVLQHTQATGAILRSSLFWTGATALSMTSRRPV